MDSFVFKQNGKIMKIINEIGLIIFSNKNIRDEICFSSFLRVSEIKKKKSIDGWRNKQ